MLTVTLSECVGMPEGKERNSETLMIISSGVWRALFAKLMEQVKKDIFVKFTFSGKIPFLCRYVEFLGLGFNGYVDILWMYEGP